MTDTLASRRPVDVRTGIGSGVTADAHAVDIVDVWGHDSFPASDAPANW